MLKFARNSQFANALTNNRSRTAKLMAVVGTLVLTATMAVAVGRSMISGFLPAETMESYYGDYTSGWLSVDITGYGSGDLDVYVYDEDGDLMARDADTDNHPYVRFYIPYAQRITVVVENSSQIFSSSYEGVVR